MFRQFDIIIVNYLLRGKPVAVFFLSRVDIKKFIDHTYCAANCEWGGMLETQRKDITKS